MNKNKGFTLIELLVVIAIIGILSSVVLASLSSARNKGKDAAVKSQLASMKAQAELYYSNNNESYSGICLADSVTGNGFGGTSGLLAAVKGSAGVAAEIQTSGAGTHNNITCHDSQDTWVVDAPLVGETTDTQMYCVDSSGVSRVEVGGIGETATNCL